MSQIVLELILIAATCGHAYNAFHSTISSELVFSTIFHAAAFVDNEASEKQEDKQQSKFPNPETEQLEIYVGPWSVTVRHYNERGDETVTVKGSEEIVWQLDRHAIGRTYTTTAGDDLYRAVSTVKWIPSEKCYRGVWFDSNPQSGPNAVSGEWTEKDKTMVWKMETTRDGVKESYKIVEKFLDSERREATTYLIEGPNTIKKFMVQYKRTVPCPGKVRTYFGE